MGVCAILRGRLDLAAERLRSRNGSARTVHCDIVRVATIHAQSKMKLIANIKRQRTALTLDNTAISVM